MDTKTKITDLLRELDDWTNGSVVAERLKISPAGAGATMKAMHKQGLLDCEWKKISRNKQTRMVPHYKVH
jgi:Mn-dependent DtxR family transcriptional regulator